MSGPLTRLLQDGTTIKKEDLDAKAGGTSRGVALQLAEVETFRSFR
jgi:hypothetical protein